MLLSLSAGTIVGLQMVSRRPGLFSAYVGSGQIVDWARQDALSYELLVRRAQARSDAAMLTELAPLARAALQGVPATATYLAQGLLWPEPFARSLAVYTALRGEIVSFDARWPCVCRADGVLARSR